jgi:polygalacturonase
MKEDYLPCNTGLFLNGTVVTPCGTGSPGNPPSDVTTISADAQPLINGPGVILASSLQSPPPSACATVNASSRDANGLNTSAIQAAIAQCSAAAAGNPVYVELTGSSGNSFTSGALFLTRNVGLWLDAGVTLNASTNPTFFQRTSTSPTASCYPPAPIPPCGTLDGASTAGCEALINACQADNSGVYGSGTIEGHGWDVVNDTHSSLGATWWARSATSKAGHYAQSLSAPEMIQFLNSMDVSVQGITVQNAPRYEITLDKVSGAVIS